MLGRITRSIASLSVFALALLFTQHAALTQETRSTRPIVYVAPIEGIIDLGLAPYIERVLAEAADAGAAAVVLDINTFGGRVDAAVQIRDALLGTKVRTIAFVNRRAISAGALISLSADTIVMAGGGTIGAATPVKAGQSGAAAEPVAEKTVSYVRKEFRATAESRKRPPLIAEAMVDSDVEIEGVIEKGKLLTLTTDEALELKLADFRADSLEALLQQAGLTNAEVRRATPNWAEEIVRFLTHPIVSSLLVTVGMLGIILELRTLGFGISGILGISSFALFFWGHWLVQLAGWEELLLLAAGLTLLAIELFVIPGFGIAGILGIVTIIAALVLSLIGAGATQSFVLIVIGRIVLALLVAIGLAVAILRVLPRLPWGRQLVLETGLTPGEGYGAPGNEEKRWIGRTGRAASTLQLAGTAEFDGERVDVVSDGELIEPGTAIEVVRLDGGRIVVRRANVNKTTTTNQEG